MLILRSTVAALTAVLLGSGIVDAATIVSGSMRLFPADVVTCSAGNPGAKAVKLEPIDAAESKLILKALADADWSQPVRYDQASPMAVFQRLGVTAADGFRPPQPLRNVQDYMRAARDWIRQHGDGYRIQRIVAADPSK